MWKWKIHIVNGYLTWWAARVYFQAEIMKTLIVMGVYVSGHPRAYFQTEIAKIVHIST